MAAKKTTTTTDSTKKGSTDTTTKKGSTPTGSQAKALSKALPITKSKAKSGAKAKPSQAVTPKTAKAKPAKAKPAKAAKAKPAKAKPTKTARRAAAPAAKTSAPKASKRGNPILHWEIQSTQPEALHEFYGDVFGWTIDAKNPMNYGMVSSQGAAGGINGGIGGTEHSEGRVIVYASVQSIADILERIEELGGKTLMPRTDIGPVVMAIYTDPEGNAMGLIEDR